MKTVWIVPSIPFACFTLVNCDIVKWIIFWTSHAWADVWKIHMLPFWALFAFDYRSIEERIILWAWNTCILVNRINDRLVRTWLTNHFIFVKQWPLGWARNTLSNVRWISKSTLWAFDTLFVDGIVSRLVKWTRNTFCKITGVQ